MHNRVLGVLSCFSCRLGHEVTEISDMAELAVS